MTSRGYTIHLSSDPTIPRERALQELSSPIFTLLLAITEASEEKKIQKVVHFAARVISGRRKFDHISDVTQSLGWLSPRDFVDFNDICLIHRILSQKQPLSVASQFKRNHQVMSRCTRQSNLLAVPRVLTKHGQRTFLCRAAKLYNAAVIAKNRQDLSVRRLKTVLKREFMSLR